MANPLFDRLIAPHLGSDRDFLILPDGRRVTYGAFLERAARFANLLQDAGLRPGGRLALKVEKSPDALAIYLAAVAVGVVFLPLNTAYTAQELDYFIENSGAGLVVVDDGSAAALKPLVARTGATLLTLNADGTGSFASRAEAASTDWPLIDRAGDDLAALLYTSGTTGRSKGAMLSHDNLLRNAEVLAEYWRFTGEDVLLHALPIYHTHGLFVATNIALLTGGAMLFLPRFDLDQVIAGLPHATAMMGVPTFYTRLLSDQRFTGDLVAHMRLFISGSAPLLAETHEQFHTRTGHRILERYGMTETNMNTSNPYAGARRAGTVGLPLPGVEVKICNAEGATLPTGEIGILEVRGPNVFQGYWQMPEKTAEELRPDGFFITGDLARIGEDGYVSIVGRGKDLIISGGLNVYPKEVETLLDDQPSVIESAVIGVPHPDFGEAVVAVLACDTAPDLAAIKATVKEGLAKFKHPKSYQIVDALPRNTMGKVQKNALRERYQDLFA